jgi:hypothetical protein
LPGGAVPIRQIGITKNSIKHCSHYSNAIAKMTASERTVGQLNTPHTPTCRNYPSSSSCTTLLRQHVLQLSRTIAEAFEDIAYTAVVVTFSRKAFLRIAQGHLLP